MSLCAFPNDTSQVSNVFLEIYNLLQLTLTFYCRLKIKVTVITHSQVQSSPTKENKWTEIVEDLWKCLPHFQHEERLYDDRCLKIDCEAEESESDSETWLHQSTTEVEDLSAEVKETKEECELTN